jgi:dTDP-4-dehydrorhamnose reductase
MLLGKNGQLGWELQRCLAPLSGHSGRPLSALSAGRSGRPLSASICGLDYPEIDLSNPAGLDQLRRQIREFQPAILVNATAYTAVDRAESEPELAFTVNAEAPKLLAEEAARLGTFLLHYSTDYVFDGSKGSLYTEQDLPNPLNVYGSSKLAGEQAITALDSLSFLILRTAWVFSTRANSFVTKVLEWSRSQKVLRLVSDQVSNPTSARLLAEISAQVLAMALAQPDPQAWLAERKGLYHLAGDGCASRMEWGSEILRLDPRREEQAVTDIQPALTSDFPSPANRPLFSALHCDHFTEVFKLRLPPWQTALSLAMDDADTIRPQDTIRF